MRLKRIGPRLGAGLVAAAMVLGGATDANGATPSPTEASDNPSAALPSIQRPLLPLTQYVDPVIGGAVPRTSGYAGNINPGAKVPFGFTHFGPDMPRTNFNGSGGYLTAADSTSERVNFFSLTHLNGVGCPGQGTVGMMPASTPTAVSTADGRPLGVRFATATEKAAPGYYSVGLDNDVKVELTATERTGMARFTYPGKDAGYFSLDTRLNGNSNASWTAGRIEAKNVSLAVSDNGRTLTGRSIAPAFCTPYGTPYNSAVYFYAELDKPLRSQSGASTVNTVDDGSALLQYDLPAADPTLTMRVGISAVSIDNARLNLKTENARSTFEQVRAQADKKWNARLNTIQIDRAANPRALSPAQREVLVKFYSSLYRVFVGPTTYSDVNGDFRSMQGSTPAPGSPDLGGAVEQRPVANVRDYTWRRPDGRIGSYSTHYSGFSMWDTYRSQAQLLALLAPRESAEMMQSLVVDAKQCGAFPHWVDASDDSTPMSGDNALPLIAGAYQFGVRDYDLVSAARLVKQSAFDPGSTCNNNKSFSGMTDYLQTGYFPDTSSPNIERYNSDRAAAAYLDALPRSIRTNPQVAVTDADIAKLHDRAGWWRTILNPETKAIAAREAPTTPGTLGEWTTGWFHESTEPNYFWSFGYAWTDLIHAIGGKQAAVDRLNALFSIDTALTRVPTAAQLNGGQDSQGFYIGNEMGYPAPWAYNWAGAPASTQYVVQKIMDLTFSTRRDGLPGNDDMGATSSWYVFAALGMFPTVASAPGLSLSTPQFPRTTMWVGDRPVRITTDADASTAPFIQSLRLNWRAYPASWLPLRQLRYGAKLDFALGASPSQWAAADALTPPSGADADYTRMTANGDPRTGFPGMP
ncbi:MAG: glycoside hydrolase family 92 protein [Intrasporangium sp.]|uniref:GH92 family glycosyl hydrolase n=1 Tax=Intrasporangium sp. TaxID=1925024 RepID=UPI0026482530|nr:glycoside hydrolase domain-containing protein [Intrasporangium sp.]MDN5794331.1 glycoside hydrolase family 92 protein [Intrasporangium sp.]